MATHGQPLVFASIPSMYIYSHVPILLIPFHIHGSHWVAVAWKEYEGQITFLLVNNDNEDSLLQSELKTESNRPNPLDTVEREKKTENDLREKTRTELIFEEELNVEHNRENFVK